MFIIFAFSFSEWVSILPVSEAPGLVAAGEDRPGSAELSVSGRSAPQVGGTAGPGSVERKLGRKWRRLRGTRVRTTLGRIVSWLKGGCSDEAHLQSRAEERRGEERWGEGRRGGWSGSFSSGGSWFGGEGCLRRASVSFKKAAGCSPVGARSDDFSTFDAGRNISGSPPFSWVWSRVVFQCVWVD